MASPLREWVSDRIGLVRDWVQFRRYERALKQAVKVGVPPLDIEDEPAENASPSRWGMETTARNRTIGGIVLGAVIMILLLVLFSCTVSGGSLQGGPTKDPMTGESDLPSDPDTLEPQPTGVPQPDMDLESAYEGGYFTDPDTEERYLVAQIDRAAGVPSGWFCRPATGLPTRQCLVAMGWTPEEVPEDWDEVAPDDSDDSDDSASEPRDEAAPAVQPAPDGGQSDSGGADPRDEGSSESTQQAPKDNGRPVEWVTAITGVGVLAMGVVTWMWPKGPERERFQRIRRNLRGRAFGEELQRELLEQIHAAVTATSPVGPAEVDSSSRRPGDGRGDLAPPV